jgi:hypothetical protein
MIGLVAFAHMAGIAIGIRVYGDARHSNPTGSARDAANDLAAVGNQ